jgi:conjugative transfer protein CagX
MTRVLLTLLAVAFTVPAQKIESETPARDRVVRVQTALNHLTVIEVAEPVTTVAVGSPQAFRVERRENKVFIQPLEENVATNLFIWTATTRLNYELVPAISDAGQMDFAIDYRQPPRDAELQPLPPRPKPARQSELPIDMLWHGTPVKLVGFPHSKQPHVDVTIRDVYRTENQLFIRYAIENRSKSPYQPSTPRVVSLRSPQCDCSLTSLANSQLGDKYLPHLRSDGTIVMAIVHAETPAASILPGAYGGGVVALQIPQTDQPKANGTPTVLRMVFPGDGPRQVIATLVL